jgi:hypothetical protein
MRRMAWTALVLLIAGPAVAETVDGGDHACTCRFKQRRIALGDEICLDTAAGPRLAMCVMRQNLPFYAISDEGCALSSAAPARSPLRRLD